MPETEGLFKADPMIAMNFFLELDGETVSILTSVSGLDIEVGVSKIVQAGRNGQNQLVKGLGQTYESPDLQLTRVAALDVKADKMWTWFSEIRTGKLGGPGSRDNNRKNGSVVMFSADNSEVARFNFYNAWPSKISTDQLSVDSSEVVKETITLITERVERVK